MLAANFSPSEVRYRRLFETARDGILVVDPLSRRIIDVNPFLKDFLGYTHEEFIGCELFEIGLLKDEAASRAAFRELQTTGRIRYDDLPLETKDGRRVEVEFVSSLYDEGDRQVIQCNIRDITARKKIELALHEATERLSRHTAELEETVARRTAELRASNSQLETFVYTIAHDLRAPLRAMQGFSQLLVEEHSAALDEEGRGFARIINTAAQKMDGLLADLLAFSHVSQRQMSLVPVPLAPVVETVLAGYEAEILRSGALVENDLVWPEVLAHAATLQQVLVNLVGNALKFVSGKSALIRLRTEARPGGVIRIWVEDNGIGIPLKFQQRIFEPFQRLHTNAYSGTGIGLAIVQKGVERMGGRTGVVSKSGEGSRFWVELAVAFAPAESAS